MFICEIVIATVLGVLWAAVGYIVFDYRELFRADFLRRLGAQCWQPRRCVPRAQDKNSSACDIQPWASCAPCASPEQAGELAVVTCHFNPAAWGATRQNYIRFLNEMKAQSIPVFSAEVAFPGQSFVSSDSYLQLRASGESILWQKERLLNRIVETIPQQYSAIALVDADILFFDPNWAKKALAQLQIYSVVQLFDRLHRLDRHGKVASTYAGIQCVFGAREEHRIQRSLLAPWLGAAWAVRRSVFPLYDRCILGGGDVANLEGWLGLGDTWLRRQMSSPEKIYFNYWAGSAMQRVDGRVGQIRGSCAHLYHGRVKERLYAERHLAARVFDFDPERHIAVDDNGLLCWTKSCPSGLRAFVEDYFSLRREDRGLI